ncbi:protein FAM149A isoform X2 [Hydra vulgaris]|uniref:Protein FAM149A isoform X2 n=1 Tax=Hydra vulgaris TaxID=6087 RepID=A0ABM4D369_HYDVU
MDKIQRHLYENKQQHMAMFDSWVLRGHGIFDTKSVFETLPPLPEKYYEPSVLNIKEENSDFFDSNKTPTDNSSAFEQFCQSWSDNGEIFTERSSVFSWRHDDEFDRGAASQVQQIFLDVDSCLYESMETKLSNDLNNECAEWTKSFPYLRLVGHQLMPSNDSGTHMIEVHSEKDELSEKNKQHESDFAQDPLLVNGCKVEAKTAPNDTQFDETSYLYLEEEIFAANGDIEEFIAYDCSTIDVQTISFDEKKYYKEAIPPVAPAASIHDRIISECFDKVWNKLVYIFTDLMKLYAKAKSRKGYGSNYLSQYDEYDEENEETFHEIPSRSSIRLKTSAGQATSYDHDLKELMIIRPISLQERLSFPNILRDDDVSRELVVSRPVSSSIGIHRQFPKSSTFRNAEQMFHDRMASAKVTNKKAVRLQPLPVSKVPSSINQESALLNEIRGKSLQTPQAINQLNSRVVTLPPLERLNINEPMGRIRSSKKSMRVSSAATNNKNSDAHEKNTFATQDIRPNTTHSLGTEILSSKKSGLFYNNRITHNDHHSMMSKAFEEESENEFNTFVLWGQPLISTQKSFSHLPQKKSRNGNK